MFGIHDLTLFVLSGLLLNITPGPDMLYIIGRGSAHGPRAGLVAALGVGAGCMVHVSAASLGLSVILAASATAFSVVKLAGAAYLVWVGICLLRTRANGREEGAPAETVRRAGNGCAGTRAIFLQGFLTNALNPKVALFFLAFLPQFIDPASPQKSWAFLLLGLIFTLNGTIWNLFVGWSSARIAGRMSRGGALSAWFNRGVGAVFLYLGCRLALAERA